MASPVLRVRGLRMTYGKVVVLEDIGLTARAGEIVAITGVNGVGKSTLLTCLAGLRRPASGSVTVLGAPPSDTPEFWRAVALVAEQPTWYPGLTVRELLELVRMTQQPLHGWCLPPDELIEAFGLTARADASPLSLSSGQRQRLSLAAALARPSRLLLLDEPEQSLDAGFRRYLATLLREEYAANGGTVIMATHDQDFAANAEARVIELEDGRVAEPPDEEDELPDDADDVPEDSEQEDSYQEDSYQEDSDQEDFQEDEDFQGDSDQEDAVTLENGIPGSPS